MSSLLRAEAVAVLREGSAATLEPRVFGSGRVLRGEQVGLNPPMPLPVPVPTSLPALELEWEPEPVPEEPAAPNFTELEEAARVNGYNRGHEEGYAAGLAAAEAAMAESVQQLVRLASAVLEQHAAFYRAAERQVVDLALQIAQKVVEHEVENMPDLAVGVIRAALDEMDARTAVRVRVSPADEELLRRRWARVVPPGVDAERIELQADERIQSGGAVIETTQGQVDAQLETKLAQLGNALWTFVTDSTAKPDHADA
jgi:flagellar biosynthesis/type III secretory pathway protein FliH